jgi:hypothetical protein
MKCSSAFHFFEMVWSILYFDLIRILSTPWFSALKRCRGSKGGRYDLVHKSYPASHFSELIHR